MFLAETRHSHDRRLITELPHSNLPMAHHFTQVLGQLALQGMPYLYGTTTTSTPTRSVTGKPIFTAKKATKHEKLLMGVREMVSTGEDASDDDAPMHANYGDYGQQGRQDQGEHGGHDHGQHGAQDHAGEPHGGTNHKRMDYGAMT